MPYVKYTAQVKVIALTKFMAGQTMKSINEDLTTAISAHSFSRWKSLYDETQAVVRSPATYEKRGRKTIHSDIDCQFMVELLEADPTMFLDEIQEAMYDHTDLIACRQTIANDLKERLFLTVHKASKVDINQSPERRAIYSGQVAHLPSKCLVFLDETGLRPQDVQRNKVRSQKGERPKALRRTRAGSHYSMLAAICELGLLAVNAKVNAYHRTEFEAFLKHVLLPVMRPYPERNSVLILDNVSIHRRGAIEALCNAVGVVLVYLSPYSPSFNPIERTFKVFKDALRRNGLFAEALDKIGCMKRVMSQICTSTFIKSLYVTGGYRKREYAEV